MPHNFIDVRSEIDPAIAAIALFDAARERFEMVLTERNRAESALLALGAEPGSPEHDQARAELWPSDLDARENALGKAYEACLSAAFATVPRTLDGARELAGLIQEQQMQVAPEAMIGIGAESLVRALGRRPCVDMVESSSD